MSIPLVAKSGESPKPLGLWLVINDGEAVELKGGDIEENKLNLSDMTYEYKGATAKGENLAEVRNYLCQFTSEQALKEYIEGFMSAYAKEPAFYGVMLTDEPKDEQLGQVALVKKIVRELFPEAYTQSCLLPCYANDYNDFAEWKAAIDKYVALEGVKEIGIDFYPYIYKKNILSAKPAMRDNWLASLQYLADTANSYGLKFETTVQSHGVDGVYQIPSSAQLNLQVQLSLAFGAEKIGYYTYKAHDGDGNVTGAIAVNSDLKQAVTEANAIIVTKRKAMFNYSYNAKSAIYGSSGTCIDTSNYISTGLSESVIKSSDAYVLVTEYYDYLTGKYGYYIVNITDPKDGKTAEIILNGNYGICNGTETVNSDTVIIPSGGGVFITAG